MAPTVIFDLDDTLCDYSGARTGALDRISRATRDPAGFLSAYAASEPGLFQAFAARAITLAEYRRRRFAIPLASVGEGDPDGRSGELNRLFMRACNEDVLLFPEVLESVAALRTAGWRMGLLTNGPSDGQRTKIACLGLTELFDAIAIGEEIECFKPDPRAFAVCLAMLGSWAEETWVIGDSIEMDILPAMKADLRAILVSRATPSTSAPVGIPVAPDLAAAIRLLEPCGRLIVPVS